METIRADIVIIGAGGAGLRAAIAAAESDPDLEIALISKVYPMRSHTVAAEGGAAGVVQDHDSVDYHFEDTVSGGDWLCDQDTVEYFVNHAAEENYQLEHWGCPWSRRPDGSVNVRAFGGMKIERTWFAADKSGFHILHTLFQTSTKYPNIRRYDEYFCTDLLVEDERCYGVQAIEVANGTFNAFLAKAVIIATGGAGRVYKFNTNGGIVTGDGMALAYRQGVPLRDMEFVQYHPTGLPGSGILITEACRGEGGILTNKDGYRYLQDYGLGPETPLGHPKNKYMELGPRDKLSQAFWHEEKKGRVIQSGRGTHVNLDLRHLGEKYIEERLPLIRESAMTLLGVDAATTPIPVRPTVHYTMGGIQTNALTQTPMTGLFAVGECASCGLHGANRLGSNSLSELSVFGKVAGEEAAALAKQTSLADVRKLLEQAEHNAAGWNALRTKKGTESTAAIRKELADAMEEGVGIYRSVELLTKTRNKISELQDRYQNIDLKDGSLAFNTEWLYAIELGFLLDVGEAMTVSADARKESRGSHQRLDEFNQRDDENYLTHTLALFQQGKTPSISYQDVIITKSKPSERVYGAASEKAAN
ncbi:MAG: fumarate reductase (quinol) flavoprotein subunit [Xanthomonadales bacterium]|nr:fumarate reductase (quinol) flavoprotein subunit [Xanthomonadales bacterium]